MLLKVHHTRLLHLLPRGVPVDDWGQWAIDPAGDPAGWLAGLERPADAGLRVCAMLADQAVVHACDLDEDELRWLSDKDPTDGAALARSFGLTLEHRLEGAAWVMPQETYDERVAGRFRFPGRRRSDAGTVRHAALLLIDGLVSGGDRSFELPDGRLVPLTDEDLDHLPLPPRHVAEVLGFVPGTDIDPISYGRAYYAAPDGPAADRPYVVLTEVLARTGYVGLCEIAIGRRERLAVLRPRHGVLVCQTLLWQDELRDPGDLAPSIPVTDQKLQLAETLLSELTGIEMRELHDEYGRALEQLVDAKVAGSEVETLPVPQPAADLLAALEESVRAARTSRSGEAD